MRGDGPSAPVVDVFFAIRGNSIALDHGYALYAAISRTIEAPDDLWLHASSQAGLHLIRGLYEGRGRLSVGRRARFGLRLPASLLPKVLPLAGKALDLGGDRLRIGVPHVQALRPAAAIHARIVSTRNGQDAARFEAEIRRQLLELDIRGTPAHGPRRVFRIKDKTVVGHGVRMTGLSPEESIRLQEHGLGGRRKMGCGVFVPSREGEER